MRCEFENRARRGWHGAATAGTASSKDEHTYTKQSKINRTCLTPETAVELWLLPDWAMVNGGCISVQLELVLAGIVKAVQLAATVQAALQPTTAPSTCNPAKFVSQHVIATAGLAGGRI